MDDIISDDTATTGELAEAPAPSTESRSVLAVSARSFPDGTVEFTNEHDTALRVSRALFAALGRPETVTLTVEPGE